MPRLQSRAQREVEFLEVATNMEGQLADWYDQHPAASLGEMETEARRLRRELRGVGLAVLITGRDTGCQLDAPPCPPCGPPPQFVGYRPWRGSGLEGEPAFARADDVCRAGEAQPFFPPGSETELTRRSWE